MILEEVMNELASLATPSTKKTLLRHGAKEPLFGVRIGDMKNLVKRLKGKQDIAIQLYETNNSDAMYLAGLIANGSLMSEKQINGWAQSATWHMISGSTIPWVACEHPKGMKLALKWIDSSNELVAISGWSTLASLAAVTPDDSLPIETLSQLLDRCNKSIAKSPNRVRYSMNSYIICIGTYVEPLFLSAIKAARQIGNVDIDMGDTACKVPDAESQILKARKNGVAAAKRKTMRC